MFKVKLFSAALRLVRLGLQHDRSTAAATDYDKGTQRKTGSLSFSPTLSAPFTAIPWLTMDTVGHGEIRLLPAELRAGDDDGRRRAAVHDERDSITAEVVGPVFSKVYRNKQGDPVFKHSHRADRELHSSTARSAEAKRIITTYVYFFRYHQLEYGITNRFYVKDGTTSRASSSSWG